MIPRIRGKVGQANHPPEMAGKWFFEMWLSDIGDGEGKSIGMCGPYENKDDALVALRHASQVACEACEVGMGQKPSGEYIDMKTNTTKYWDRRNEN